MTKKFTSKDLGDIVSSILLDPSSDAISGYEVHQAFMTELADSLCVQVGGQTVGMAELVGTQLSEWVIPVAIAEDDDLDDAPSLWSSLLPRFESIALDEQGRRIIELQAGELSQMVNVLLNPEESWISSFEGFQSYMTDVADVICNHCGGQTAGLAQRDQKTGTWTVRIAPNESLPDDGGIWSSFTATSNADLVITSYYRDRANGVHAAKAT